MNAATFDAEQTSSARSATPARHEDSEGAAIMTLVWLEKKGAGGVGWGGRKGREGKK